MRFLPTFLTAIGLSSFLLVFFEHHFPIHHSTYTDYPNGWTDINQGDFPLPSACLIGQQTLTSNSESFIGDDGEVGFFIPVDSSKIKSCFPQDFATFEYWSRVGQQDRKGSKKKNSGIVDDTYFGFGKVGDMIDAEFSNNNRKFDVGMIAFKVFPPFIVDALPFANYADGAKLNVFNFKQFSVDNYVIIGAPERKVAKQYSPSPALFIKRRFSKETFPQSYREYFYFPAFHSFGKTLVKSEEKDSENDYLYVTDKGENKKPVKSLPIFPIFRVNSFGQSCSIDSNTNCLDSEPYYINLLDELRLQTYSPGLSWHQNTVTKAKTEGNFRTVVVAKNSGCYDILLKWFLDVYDGTYEDKDDNNTIKLNEMKKAFGDDFDLHDSFGLDCPNNYYLVNRSPTTCYITCVDDLDEFKIGFPDHGEKINSYCESKTTNSNKFILNNLQKDKFLSQFEVSPTSAESAVLEEYFNQFQNFIKNQKASVISQQLTSSFLAAEAKARNQGGKRPGTADSTGVGSQRVGKIISETVGGFEFERQFVYPYAWCHVVAYSLGVPSEGMTRTIDQKDIMSDEAEESKSNSPNTISRPQVSKALARNPASKSTHTENDVFNLVIGLAHANYRMTQHESYASALLSVLSQVDQEEEFIFQAQVTANVKFFDCNPSGKGDSKAWPWIPESILYEISFSSAKKSKNNNQVFSTSLVNFNMWSEYIPFIMEIEIDKYILDNIQGGYFDILSGQEKLIVGDREPSSKKQSTKRSLLQFDFPTSNVNSLTSSSSSLLAQRDFPIKLNNLMSFRFPSILGQLGFHNVNVFYDTLYSPPFNYPVNALHINASLPLDDKYIAFLSKPLGLKGDIDADVYLYPFPSSDFSLIASPLSFGPSRIRLKASYNQFIYIAPGVIIENIHISVDTSIVQPKGLSSSGPIFTVGGTVDFPFPDRNNQLTLDVEVQYVSDTGKLFFCGYTSNANGLFGIPLLNFRNFKICSSLGKNGIDLFDISMVWAPSSSFILSLDGLISSESVAVSTSIGNFSLSLLDSMNFNLFSSRLDPLDFDLEFTSVSISFANSNVYLNGQFIPIGLGVSATISLDIFKDLQIQAALSENAVTFKASLKDTFDIGIPTVSIENPSLIIQYSSSPVDSGTSVNVDWADKGAIDQSVKSGQRTTQSFITIAGTVHVGSLSVQSSIYYSNSPRAWVLLVSLKDFHLSSLFGFLSGSPFDFSIPSMVLSWTSSSSAYAQPGVVAQYPHLKSLPADLKSSSAVVISASLDPVPLIDSLLHCHTTGVLSLIYDGNTESLDMAITVALTNFTIGSFQGANLGVLIKYHILLIFGVQFQLYISLPGNDKPSEFTALITFDGITAAFAASLTNTDPTKPAWPNAFGVNGLDLDHLGIGAGINVESGLPDELAIDCQFDIHTGDGQNHAIGVSACIGASPSNEMIRLYENNMDWMVMFAMIGKFSGISFGEGDIILALVSEMNFVKIQTFELYFSNGAQIGSEQFPPGGDMSITLSLFDTFHGNMSGKILPAKGGLIAQGQIDSFNIIGISLQGIDDHPNPGFGMTLTVSDQRFWVAGSISIFGIRKSQIYVSMSLTSIQCKFSLNLIDLIEIEISASAHGSIVDPFSSSFSLSASIDFSQIIKIFQNLLNQCKGPLNDLLGDVSAGYQIVVQAFLSASAELQKEFTVAINNVISLGNKVTLAKQQLEDVVSQGKAVIAAAQSDVISAAAESVQLVVDETERVSTAINSAKDELSNIASSFTAKIKSARDWLNYLYSVLDYLNSILNSVLSFFGLSAKENSQFNNFMKSTQRRPTELKVIGKKGQTYIDTIIYRSITSQTEFSSIDTNIKPSSQINSDSLPSNTHSVLRRLLSEVKYNDENSMKMKNGLSIDNKLSNDVNAVLLSKSLNIPVTKIRDLFFLSHLESSSSSKESSSYKTMSIQSSNSIVDGHHDFGVHDFPLGLFPHPPHVSDKLSKVKSFSLPSQSSSLNIISDAGDLFSSSVSEVRDWINDAENVLNELIKDFGIAEAAINNVIDTLETQGPIWIAQAKEQANEINNQAKKALESAKNSVESEFNDLSSTIQHLESDAQSALEKLPLQAATLGVDLGEKALELSDARNIYNAISSDVTQWINVISHPDKYFHVSQASISGDFSHLKNNFELNFLLKMTIFSQNVDESFVIKFDPESAASNLQTTLRDFIYSFPPLGQICKALS